MSSSSSSYSYPVELNSPSSDWALQLSKMLSALGSNQYSWAMNQFNNGMGITNDNIAHYMDLAGKGAGLAQNLLGRYTDVFEPIMDQYVRMAGTYNSEARQRFNMGQAESTVGQADTAARSEAERKLQGFGINPNSGRYQDLMLTSRVQDAAARAGAGTQASQQTAATGRQMLQQAAQMGQNLPGMTVNALQSAYTGLTGAENALLGMLNTGTNMTSSAAQFYNAAANANKFPPVGQNSRSGSNTTNPSGGGKDQGGPSNSNGRQQQPFQPRGQYKSAAPASPQGPFQPRHYSNLPPDAMAKQVNDNSGEAWNGAVKDMNDANDTGALNPDWNGGDSFAQRSQDANGQDAFDPQTYAGAQGSPWWQDPNQTNGGPLVPDWNGSWDGGQTQTGQTDQSQLPSPQDWGLQPGQSNPFSEPPADPWANAPGGPTPPPAAADDNMAQADQPQDPTVGTGDQFGGFDPNGWQDPSQDQNQGGDPNQDNQNYQDQGGDTNAWDYQNQDQNQGGDPSAWDYQNQDYQSQDYQNQDYQSQDYQDQSQSDNNSWWDYQSGDNGGYYAQGGAVKPRLRHGASRRGGRGVLPSPTTGGAVPRSASPSQGRQTDDISARLNAGEFVMPRDVVAHKGTEFFRKLIEGSRKARTGMAGAPARPQMKPALRLKPSFVSQRV